MNKVKAFFIAVNEVLGYTKQLALFFLWTLWLFATWFTVPILWSIFPPLTALPFIPVAYIVLREQTRIMKKNRENRLKLIDSTQAQKATEEYIADVLEERKKRKA